MNRFITLITAMAIMGTASRRRQTGSPATASRGELALRRAVCFVGFTFGCFLILRGSEHRAFGFVLVFLNAGDAFRLPRHWQIVCLVAGAACIVWSVLQLIRS